MNSLFVPVTHTLLFVCVCVHACVCVFLCISCCFLQRYKHLEAEKSGVPVTGMGVLIGIVPPSPLVQVKPLPPSPFINLGNPMIPCTRHKCLCDGIWNRRASHSLSERIFSLFEIVKITAFGQQNSWIMVAFPNIGNVNSSTLTLDRFVTVLQRKSK